MLALAQDPDIMRYNKFGPRPDTFDTWEGRFRHDLARLRFPRLERLKIQSPNVMSKPHDITVPFEMIQPKWKISLVEHNLTFLRITDDLFSALGHSCKKLEKMVFNFRKTEATVEMTSPAFCYLLE